MDKQLRNAIVSGRLIFWVPAMALIAVVVIAWFLSSLNRGRQFDSALWQNHQHFRSGMVGDLLDRHQLVGMSRTEINELLGKPNGTDSNQDDSYVYRTGTDGGIDDLWLEIDFADGIVTAIRHVPD